MIDNDIHSDLERLLVQILCLSQVDQEKYERWQINQIPRP